MNFEGIEQTGKTLEALGIALQRIAEAARNVCEWLADYFSSEEFRERMKRARREVEARKRRRKQFTEWNRAEERRRAEKCKQYGRVSIMPGGRQYFRTQHRARKPP